MKNFTRFKQKLLFVMYFTILLTMPVYSMNPDNYSTSFEISDCSDCEGKITTLSLQYIGDLDNPTIMVKQKKGDHIIFNDTVTSGDTFTFTGVDKKGTLSTMVYIYINGILASEIHTSCSVPVGPGMIFGDFEVVAGDSLHGGNLCPIEGVVGSNSDECGDCEGKITTLSLQYTGDLDNPTIVVKQKKGDHIIFDDTVTSGDTFTFTGVDKKGTLGTMIYIYINDILVSEIHTSCSVDIGPGMTFGDFEVVAGASLHGGDLCSIEDESCDVSVSDDQSNCSGESVILTATGGDSYIWSTGETTATITTNPTETTIYSVEITTSTCVVTKEVIVTIITTGCGFYRESSTFLMYPTTLKGQEDIHLSFDFDQSQDVSVTVHNLYGHQIYKYKNLSYTTGRNTQTISLSAISKLEIGIYLITITGNGWVRTERILIK